jgi:hypothetical protein
MWQRVLNSLWLGIEEREKDTRGKIFPRIHSQGTTCSIKALLPKVAITSQTGTSRWDHMFNI